MELDKESGRGRPMVFTRLDQDTIDQLNEYSQTTGIRRATLIRMIIETALAEGLDIKSEQPEEPEPEPESRYRTRKKGRRAA